MTLRRINRVLRFFGLVLVVQIDDEGGPTELWIERARRYVRRTRR